MRKSSAMRASFVGAVYDRAYFVDSKKSARSQTAPTVPFLCKAILTMLLAVLTAPVFAQSGKNSENTEFAKGDFFIVSSIDLARKQILLKRPTEVTELMRVDGETRSFDERGNTMQLADIRAGDTVYVTFQSSGGQPLAVTIRKGPMTLEVLRERYLQKTK
jgi:hypothetical protein